MSDESIQPAPPFQRGKGIRPEQIVPEQVKTILHDQRAPTSQTPQEAKKKEKPDGPQEYGRLPLLSPLALSNGAVSNEVVIYRPTCGQMTEVLDTIKLNVQIERFVTACCRAVNGTGDTYSFNGGELSSIDGSELAAVITSMSQDADSVFVDETVGDGITQPFVYTLKRPINMGSFDEDEIVTQFEFLARKISDITEYLDARGETREFHTFMRTFGRPVGLRFPLMSDTLINTLDFLDYLVIRRQILPKFVTSRARWKRASTNAP